MTRLYLGAILAITALLRFWRLDQPGDLVFDEIYYVDGARDYLSVGVEIDGRDGEFVVHPPFGKWLIAVGIRLFGDNSFGWRFSSALAGTIAIALIFLIAKKLFASDYLALIAALLSTLDGLHLVMSRVALLDMFLTTLLLAGVLSFLYQKHLLSALFFGLALSTKWNALFLIATLLIYLLVKERRSILYYLFVIPVTYLSSWIGWFQSDLGYDRLASANPLLSLFNYHRKILDFHNSLDAAHPYQASPWTWLFLGRPTSFFYESPKCGAGECSREILAMGTPLIWWLGVIALLFTLKHLFLKKDWIAGFIVLTFAASYLPWLLFPERTTFYFYAITLQPFLILSICYSVHVFLKTPIGERYGEIAVQSAISLVTLIFIYFLPIFVGTTLSYEAWSARMWFESWI